ncbi:NAD(P)H-hydrate dehydratase [Aeromicrobium wangtongii]|uniref:ADP-dependent (S)-NAD(P)H-hydrate dehydratase n=1 Tax=Aeromicrobium wangtongii TaxID=2969247 RepID=A0ABY5M7F2_9ACTN|nr:NAD(P)H-hydrate dehydratase [Aeromicrobium wangtongii]MCD9199736.1 NAD(P)H-hydrate dehydratase [Aeromicrobium wangtongii]UUP14085.1 NAD(P)H-hydrate dehydratase [Aeromicrobium wangtongii]
MSAREVVSLTPAFLREWPLPSPQGDKSSRGTVLVIGGSRSTPGAVILAGTAAMRAGAGKLQIATSESTAPALGVAVPEAMVIGLPETPMGNVAAEPPQQLLDLVSSADVVVVGPGLFDGDETDQLLAAVLGALGDDSAAVVDACALASVARRPEVLEGCADRVVLTPNQSEGAGLLDRELSDDLDAEAAEIAQKYGCVVSLFGHIAGPVGGAWRDETAGSGLGTSGSGDVAAGMVGGLLARGAEPSQAACWGINVHAAAGQRLAVERGRTSYLAREIVDGIAPALAALEV